MTFDVFETVLDLEGRFERALEDYFEQKGAETDVFEFYRRYQQYLVFVQMTDAHIDTPRVPFKDLCRRSLTYQHELVLDRDDVAPNEVMHVAAHAFDTVSVGGTATAQIEGSASRKRTGV